MLNKVILFSTFSCGQEREFGIRPHRVFLRKSDSSQIIGVLEGIALLKISVLADSRLVGWHTFDF